MTITIEVNNRQIRARKGETLLSALRRNGIGVPTLCHMPELDATGACRICVVEVEGKTGLVTSCSQPVEEWMKVSTHSPRVIRARKTLVELLLANHPDDCLFCLRNGCCELQNLAGGLLVRERRFSGCKSSPACADQSSAGIVRDPAKCILCSRCVRTCEEIVGLCTLVFINRGEKTSIGIPFGKSLNLSNCISCGQCLLNCPTAALRENEQMHEVQNILHQDILVPVVQYSPVIPVTLAEEFGFKPGKDLQGVMNACLRKLGFRHVFEVSFAADLLINELVEELIQRLNRGKSLPLINSCCPGWVKYAEQYLPEHLPLLAPFKSPQQLLAKLIKTYYAENEAISPDKIHITSLTPCIAGKFEAQREEHTLKGMADIDAVLTTRELARLIRLNGIDIHQLDEEISDRPFTAMTSAGKLPGTSGGLTEALIRTLYFRLTGDEMKNTKISRIRGLKEKKELYLTIGEKEFGFASVSTLKQLMPLLDEIQSGKKKVQFVEVMACPGGCVNGGGQPMKLHGNTVQLRMKTLYDLDDKEPIKLAHRNPGVIDLYQKTLESPGSQKARECFPTTFSPREVML